MTSPAVTTTTTLFAQLREQVAAWMETYSVPGVAIGLMIDGEEHTISLNCSFD